MVLGLLYVLPKVVSGHHNCFAHFKQSRSHLVANAISKRIENTLLSVHGIVVVHKIRCEDGNLVFAVTVI